MTTYIYVGPTSAGLADGTSWANRYGTLNAAEDRPIVADTVVYVGPGTYRELLTCDVSGAAGQTISYIGDYTGASTDGVGGVVRITGAAANERSASRDYCIVGSAKNYRTFRGFTMDTATYSTIALTNGCTNWTIDGCYLGGTANNNYSVVSLDGAGQAALTVSNCFLRVNTNSSGVYTTHGATVDNAGHVVSSCVFVMGHSSSGVRTLRVGGITVRNCLFTAGTGVSVGIALSVGQKMTVNNCIFNLCQNGVTATTTAEFDEDYNAFFGNNSNRSNVNVGANSNAYPFHPDSRWFHEATNGGRFVTPFDMASYCALVNVAGTSPTATDMRGTAVQGSEREIGALEYDSTLLIESAGGGGPVRILPIRGSVG